MKKLLVNLIIISTVGSAAFGLTSSFFSDTETSATNTLTAGRLDLKINGGDNTPNIVNLTDLKPGDNQIVPKTLFIDFNPAKVWMHLKDVTATQGAQTEPEVLEENGTPKFDLQNYITYDLTVAENVIISQADNINILDAVSCWIPLGELPGNVDVKVYQSFHLPSSVTNWAQGDQLNFTEEFLAQQKNDPTIPVTGSGRVWNPQLKKCISTNTPTPSVTPSPTPIACVETYPTSFEQNLQGKNKDGSSVLASRSNGNFALGAPQTTGTPVDGAVPANSFFSLGFTNGSLVLKFTSPFIDKPGNDLQVFEVTGDTTPPYPDELVKVEVSSNGINWTQVAASLNRDGLIDISPVPSAQYVRLTDVSNINLFDNAADGYDLDAVKAFCGKN